MKAKTFFANAEASVAGVAGTAIMMRVTVAALSREDRRALFSTLLRDPEVVTAKADSPEALAFTKALDAVCKWGNR